jgi:excisionase family DNA binding protein
MSLLNVGEVAQMLCIKPRTVYVWVQARKIPFKRLNGFVRFDPDEIAEWVKERSVAARTAE